MEFYAGNLSIGQKYMERARPGETVCEDERWEILERMRVSCGGGV